MRRPLPAASSDRGRSWGGSRLGSWRWRRHFHQGAMINLLSSNAMLALDLTAAAGPKVI